MHLVVCVHGFLSGPYSLKKISASLQNLSGIVLLLSEINSGEIGTSDGILNAGVRLSYEIIDFITHKNLTHISFIGSSMGSLVSRVAIGLLLNYDTNTYVSLGSPHLGISETTPFNKMIGSLLTLNTESINDFNLDTDTLLTISDPKTVYFYGLSLFKSRWLFTNIDNDGLVSYYSAGITKIEWDIPSTSSDVLIILGDYKDSDYRILNTITKEDSILRNLQRLTWNRVICATGDYGIISHAIISTGYSPFSRCDIIPTLVHIFTQKLIFLN
jgi:hypothetical protein